MKIIYREGEELYNDLVNYEAEDPFLKLEEVAEKFKYFNGNTSPNFSFKGEKFHFIVLLDNNKNIVGIIKVKTGGQESAMNPGHKDWLSFIEVLPEYRGKGYAKKMYTHLFQKLKELGYSKLLMSGYTKDGIKLRDWLIEEAKKFGIEITDKNKIEF